MPGVKNVIVHSVHSNTLRDAKNMNLLVQCPRSIVCFANLIYANRINSRGMSRVFCDLRSQKTPRGTLPVNSNNCWSGTVDLCGCKLYGKTVSWYHCFINRKVGK